MSSLKLFNKGFKITVNNLLQHQQNLNSIPSLNCIQRIEINTQKYKYTHTQM